MAKINLEIAQQIIDSFASGKTITFLANEYCLSNSNIQNIINGITWKNCERPTDIKNLLTKIVKITQTEAQQIIDEYCNGSSSYELADKYKLYQTSICNIIRGKTWKECVRPPNIKDIIFKNHTKWYGKKCIEAPPFTDLQKDVIVGSLLGDGTLHNLATEKSNSNFSKVQSKDKQKYLKWHYDILQPYSTVVDKVFSSEKLIGGNKGIIQRRKKVRKFHSGYNYRTHCHPNWTELRKQWYPNEIKIVPRDLVLNPLRIAIWFFDDGSNCVQNRTAYFCTQSFTIEEAEFLCLKLNEFNIYPKISTVLSEYTGDEMPILKIYKSSYDNLIELIKPFMLWDCFKHKINWRPAKKQREVNGKFTPDQIKEIRELRKTHKAKEIAKKFNTYPGQIHSIVSFRSYKDYV